MYYHYIEFYKTDSNYTFLVYMNGYCEKSHTYTSLSHGIKEMLKLYPYVHKENIYQWIKTTNKRYPFYLAK